MPQPIVITLAIDPEKKSVTFLSTEIQNEHIPGVLTVLRNLEDTLIHQLTGEIHEPAEG